MFGWLAKMLISTPIQGSGCACCEGKKKRLEKMQEAIAEGRILDEPVAESGKLSFSSGSFSAHFNPDGSGEFEYYAKIQTEDSCCCGGGDGCSCGENCGDDDVCHCGRGDDCCKKTGKKHAGCKCGKH